MVLALATFWVTTTINMNICQINIFCVRIFCRNEYCLDSKFTLVRLLKLICCNIITIIATSIKCTRNINAEYRTFRKSGDVNILISFSYRKWILGSKKKNINAIATVNFSLMQINLFQFSKQTLNFILRSLI